MGTTVTRAMYRTAEGLECEAPLAGIGALDVVQGAPVRLPPSHADQSNYPGLFWSTTNRDHVVYESLFISIGDALRCAAAVTEAMALDDGLRAEIAGSNRLGAPVIVNSQTDQPRPPASRR